MNNKVVKPTKFENVRLFLHLPRKVFWYWDVRLYIPIFCIVLLFTIICSLPGDASPEQITSVSNYGPTEEEIASLADNENIYLDIEFDERNIVELARLADCVGGHRNDEVKKIIMWVAINRSEDKSHGYGQSLLGEIARPKQWQGYDPESIYLDSTYMLASKVYESWKSGGARPIYSDMLWFVLNNDGSITVRNQFGSGKNRSEMTFGQ